MSEPVKQECPVCGVKIVSGGMLGDRVEYSVGAPGTRDDLYQRVCRHTQKEGCINRDPKGTTFPPR
ncbi:MAG: hypothetical protein AAFX78_19055 [Cyanobacteria bacterium J06638_20]